MRTSTIVYRNEKIRFIDGVHDSAVNTAMKSFFATAYSGHPIVAREAFWKLLRFLSHTAAPGTKSIELMEIATDTCQVSPVLPRAIVAMKS